MSFLVSDDYIASFNSILKVSNESALYQCTIGLLRLLFLCRYENEKTVRWFEMYSQCCRGSSVQRRRILWEREENRYSHSANSTQRKDNHCLQDNAQKNHTIQSNI